MTVRNSITRIHFRFRHAVCALVIMLLAILQVAPACAAVTETNSDTDYKMIIDDQAGYFSDDEIDDLTDVMTPTTAMLQSLRRSHTAIHRPHVLPKHTVMTTLGLIQTASFSSLIAISTRSIWTPAEKSGVPLIRHVRLPSQTIPTSMQPHHTVVIITLVRIKRWNRF